METNKQKEIDIKFINPMIALEYLKFKQEYEGKDFLMIWKSLILYPFSEESLCNLINTARIRRIELVNGGVTQGKAFDMIFNELFVPIIEKRNIDREVCKQLIGTLMSVYTSPKFKEFTQNYTQDIFFVLQQIHKEKEFKQQKKQEKTDKRLQKEGEFKRRTEDKMEKEVVVDKDLFDKYTSYQEEFLQTQEVGYILTTEDRQEIFNTAWKDFSEESILHKSELQKIYNEFYQKNIY